MKRPPRMAGQPGAHLGMLVGGAASRYRASKPSNQPRSQSRHPSLQRVILLIASWRGLISLVILLIASSALWAAILWPILSLFR